VTQSMEERRKGVGVWVIRVLKSWVQRMRGECLWKVGNEIPQAPGRCGRVKRRLVAMTTGRDSSCSVAYGMLLIMRYGDRTVSLNLFNDASSTA
jgi:hypothetical protein